MTVTLWCRVCACIDTDHGLVLKDETTGYMIPVCKRHGPCWAAVLVGTSIWTNDPAKAGLAGTRSVTP